MSSAVLSAANVSRKVEVATRRRTAASSSDARRSVTAEMAPGDMSANVDGWSATRELAKTERRIQPAHQRQEMRVFLREEIGKPGAEQIALMELAPQRV